jgi:predicted transcriptional regulator
MSARAAWRLETLGFDRVYRYVAGKVDWFSAGLPHEGRLAAVPRAADLVRTEVVTCRLDDRVGEVHERVHTTEIDRAVVVNDQKIVLGMLDQLALAAAPETRAEDVMDAGPVTYRPDTLLPALVEHLREGPEVVLVTTADGELVGVIRRDDVFAEGEAKSD